MNFVFSDKIKGIGVVAANLSEVQAEKEFPVNLVSVIFINGCSFKAEVFTFADTK